MPPERNEDVAQIVVGFRVVGFEGNGLPMAGDGLLAAAQVGERIAEVAVRLGEVGLEFDGAPKARERLFGLFIAPSSAVPKLLCAPANCGCSASARLISSMPSADCRRETQQQPQKVQGNKVVGRDGEEGAIEPRCLLELAAAIAASSPDGWPRPC
jgi:hypothetical protein